MKQVKKILARALVIIVLFTGVTVTLSSFGVKTISEAKAAVTSEEVSAYLMDYGYQIIDLKPVQGSENWVAHTVLRGVNYLTTVFVDKSGIIGHTDVIM